MFHYFAMIVYDRRHYLSLLDSTRCGLSGYNVVLFCFVGNQYESFSAHKNKDIGVKRFVSGTTVPVSGGSVGTNTMPSTIIQQYNSAVSYSNANPHLADANSWDSTMIKNSKQNVAFFNRVTFPNEYVAMLYAVTILVVLDRIEEEIGKLYACSLLLDVLLFIPHTVVCMHDVIFVELMRMYHETKNRRVAKALLAVINEYFRLEDSIYKNNQKDASDDNESVLFEDAIRFSTSVLGPAKAQDWSIKPEEAAGVSDAKRPSMYNIDELYMMPPPTPSKNIPDRQQSKRIMTIPTSANSKGKKSGADNLNLPSIPDESYAEVENANDSVLDTNDVVSGFAVLKSIGFAEMLYVTSFEKKPACQQNICSKLSALSSIMIERLSKILQTGDPNTTGSDSIVQGSTRTDAEKEAESEML